MAETRNTTESTTGTTTSRRRLLAGLAAAPVALALPAIALAAPTKTDAELIAAYNEVVAAYEAFGAMEDDARWDELDHRWQSAQSAFVAIPATTARGVALKLRYALATHDGWFPKQGFYSEPATKETFKGNIDAWIIFEQIGVIERMAGGAA